MPATKPTLKIKSPRELIRHTRLALYRHFNTHKLHCPNTTTVFPWEADLVSLTRANLSHEFEIKITKADFRADFKKEFKHITLAEKLARGVVHNKAPEYLVKMYQERGLNTEELERAFAAEIKNIPNYFWYVCVDFDAPIEEIPEYAGYMKAESSDEYVFLERVKAAPRIHRKKLNEEQRERLYSSINARYWNWVEGK